jgi:hypothetical protein
MTYSGNSCLIEKELPLHSGTEMNKKQKQLLLGKYYFLDVNHKRISTISVTIPEIAILIKQGRKKWDNVTLQSCIDGEIYQIVNALIFYRLDIPERFSLMIKLALDLLSIIKNTTNQRKKVLMNILKK